MCSSECKHEGALLSSPLLCLTLHAPSLHSRVGFSMENIITGAPLSRSGAETGGGWVRTEEQMWHDLAPVA